MTTWIFGVQENYPEHWDFAKRDQIWDLPSNREVLSGDLIYFWQSGDPNGEAYRPGLLGLARATSRPRRLKDDEPRPWTDAHPGNDRYKYRLDLEVIIGESSSTASWSTLQAHTGVPGMLNFGPQDVKLGDGERWLRWQLDSGETEDLSESTWSAVDDEDADEADGMDEDVVPSARPCWMHTTSGALSLAFRSRSSTPHTFGATWAGKATHPPTGFCCALTCTPSSTSTC